MKKDYPHILQRLFPGHPARRLLCTSVERNESGLAKKKVVTILRGAQLRDYSKHLDSKSYDGAGALGVIPTFPEGIGEKTRWYVRFLALDYDSVNIQEMMLGLTQLNGAVFWRRCLPTRSNISSRRYSGPS